MGSAVLGSAGIAAGAPAVDTTPAPAPAPAPASRRHRWRRRYGPVAVLVVLALTWWLVAEPFHVTSVSMEPTLRSGDQVLVDKVSYRLHPPRRHDLIVLHQPDTGQLVVKRVVGVPGDTVAIEDGVLVVNGLAQAESYIDRATVDSVYFGPESVPAQTVFVMGDNRAESIDSRSYGPVEVEAIVGRVVWRMWPLLPRSPS